MYGIYDVSFSTHGVSKGVPGSDSSCQAQIRENGVCGHVYEIRNVKKGHLMEGVSLQKIRLNNKEL